MIDGIGKGGAGRIEPQRVSSGQGTAATSAVGAGPLGARSAPLGSTVSELVAGGPPVDTDKVSALRQAIAEGRYAADPQAIAARMIEIDLRR